MSAIISRGDYHAILGRLLHNATKIQLKGESMCKNRTEVD